MNKHIGDIVEGNHPKVTNGGKLVRQFLESDKYMLVNASKLSEGGPFTRYDPSDKNNDDKKSLLDVVIVSSALKPYISKLTIDSKLMFTPFRVKKNSNPIFPEKCSSKEG